MLGNCVHCILICRCMQNHNDDTIKTSDTVHEKNIPLTLFERVVCERELATEQNCNILTPTLLAITAFLSRSPGLPNRGPTLQGAGFLYRISNSSDLQLTNFLSSPGLYNDLTSTLLSGSVTIRTHSTHPRSRL